MLIEKARIHAHLCGDGCILIHIRNRSPSSIKTSWGKNSKFKVYTIEYDNTSPALCHQFVKDIKTIYGDVYIYYKKRKGRVIVRRKMIYREMIKLGVGKSREWFIPDEILNSSKKVKLTWLRAFFDDEATIDTTHKRIDLKIVNLKGLEQIKKLLSDLGIRSYINGPYENMWILRISSGIKSFYKKVNFDHPIKKDRLRELIIS